MLRATSRNNQHCSSVLKCSRLRQTDGRRSTVDREQRCGTAGVLRVLVARADLVISAAR